MYGKHEVGQQKQKALDLDRKLARAIELTGGPRSRLVTLQDAAVLIRGLEPFRQARPVWDRAAEMILLATRTGTVADIAEATRQMLVALSREGTVSWRILPR